jgi:hypothetical protein
MASDAACSYNRPTWASLFDLEEMEKLPDQLDGPDGLAAVFHYHMSTAVRFDIYNLGFGGASQLKTLCTCAEAPEGTGYGSCSAAEAAPPEVEGAGHDLLIRSFADLLHHPCPPIALLTLTKRFAKINYNRADAVMPKEIAGVLYFSSILVALIRCGQRITELDDRALAEGVQWALNRPWLDDPTRQLLNDGLQRISARAIEVLDVSAEPS